MGMDLRAYVEGIARAAKEASRRAGLASTEEKRAALARFAASVEASGKGLLRANARDLEAARKAGRGAAFLDRLAWDGKRVADMARGVREVADLPDPVGEVIEERVRPNGIRIRKVRVPLGVVAVIYESRPNVTAEAAALCLMAGNAVVLRGGRESIRSNRALASLWAGALEPAPSLRGAVQVVDRTARRAVGILVRLDRLVDLVVPRGGEGLVRHVAETATVPVVYHAKGVCHAYVHRSADASLAERVIVNGKVQRPGVCNALEKVLVDAEVAARVLPPLAGRLSSLGVELRGDERAREIVPAMKPASPDDWDAEYLDLILAVGVVDGLQAAIAHVNAHGSGHSDAILAEDAAAAEAFCRGVDSAAVFWNASTRLHDGGQFGMGAEIGISTSRLHARGPMGVRELTTYKYIVGGTGQIRE